MDFFSSSRAHRGSTRERTEEDDAFDRLLPDRDRKAAGRFWTPVAVATRAARLFEQHGASRVLDVGAGPGKFCITAGRELPTIRWTGIEHRPRLVHFARRLVRRMGLDNVEFEVGDAAHTDWSRFDGLYFFNPFGENLFGDDSERLDSLVELSERRFMSDLRLAEAALKRVAVGTVLVTYHGFGGRIPGSFTPLHCETAGSSWLRVWIQTDGSSADETWLEQTDGSATRGIWFTARSGARDGT